MNTNARVETAEVCLNPEEKTAHKALAKVFGKGLSTWYRDLGNAELRRHGTSPARATESRGCRGPGRPANRASTVMKTRRHL